jgi:hypothetical protein
MSPAITLAKDERGCRCADLFILGPIGISSRHARSRPFLLTFHRSTHFQSLHEACLRDIREAYIRLLYLHLLLSLQLCYLNLKSIFEVKEKLRSPHSFKAYLFLNLILKFDTPGRHTTPSTYPLSPSPSPFGTLVKISP